MSCPRLARFLSCPLRNPSPGPTRSSRQPTPQAIPNIVRKERSLCAQRVANDCRTISRSVPIETCPQGPRRRMGALDCIGLTDSKDNHGFKRGGGLRSGLALLSGDREKPAEEFQG